MGNFTSLLEIGFALHFAFPIIKTFWEKHFDDLIEHISKIGTDKYIWRNIIKGEKDIAKLFEEALYVNYKAVEDTSTFIKVASITSILIAIYNISLLLIIAYGGLYNVSYYKATLLISIALLPMPVSLTYVYFKVTRNINILRKKERDFIFNLASKNVRDKKSST